MDEVGIVTVVMVSIFSVPIVAMLGKFTLNFLKFRAEQKALGASSRELEQKVERLERANAEYAERLEEPGDHRRQPDLERAS